MMRGTAQQLFHRLELVQEDASRIQSDLERTMATLNSLPSPDPDSYHVSVPMLVGLVTETLPIRITALREYLENYLGTYIRTAVPISSDTRYKQLYQSLESMLADLHRAITNAGAEVDALLAAHPDFSAEVEENRRYTARYPGLYLHHRDINIA